MLEWISILLWLSESSHSPRDRTARALIVFSCIGVMYELPSLNCGHCLVDTKCFGVDIAHFVVVVKRVQACFGAGLRLLDTSPEFRYMCATQVFLLHILKYLEGRLNQPGPCISSTAEDIYKSEDHAKLWVSRLKSLSNLEIQRELISSSRLRVLTLSEGTSGVQSSPMSGNAEELVLPSYYLIINT